MPLVSSTGFIKFLPRCTPPRRESAVAHHVDLAYFLELIGTGTAYRAGLRRFGPLMDVIADNTTPFFHRYNSFL